MIVRHLGRWCTIWSFLLLLSPGFLIGILSVLLTLYITIHLTCAQIGLPCFGVIGSDIFPSSPLSRLEIKNYQLEARLAIGILIAEQM